MRPMRPTPITPTPTVAVEIVTRPPSGRELTDSSSAACTRTNASASSNPGECLRRAAIERMNS